jgi:nitric oxide dioxygenase
MASGGCPFAAIIKETTPAVGPKVPEIINDFYPRLFKNNPEAKAFFNPANQFADPPRQRLALANAVVAYASNIDDLGPLLVKGGAVDLICHKHCGLGVQSPHYQLVHDNLMASIAHILGSDVVTPEIGKAWSDAVLFLAKALIGKEKELYKIAEARTGGWKGVRDFKVAKKRLAATNAMEFTFEPIDNEGPIDFTPGQFLTLHMKKEGATPRHYTVTSAPGESFLQCCIKKVDKGFVSNNMHDIEEGTIVGLAPPFGAFEMHEKPAVLISAGIGATPMKSFMTSSPDKVKFALHVDKDEDAVPFKDIFGKFANKFHYTSTAGRPKGSDLVESALKPYISECDFYLCGPPEFLADVKGALEAAGAKGVFVDVFGPALA